jgi:hypothetical protein
MLFDAATDEGVARDVPAEAHRRFRADLAAKKEKNLRERAAQLALHEEKKRFIAEWIEQHGTLDQRERLAVGMLPMEEAIETITDRTFETLSDYPMYKRDGVERLRQHLRAAGWGDVWLAREDLLVFSATAIHATREQWATVQDVLKKLPGSHAVLRVHSIRCKQALQAPPLQVNSVLVTLQAGPLLLRREYGNV